MDRSRTARHRVGALAALAVAAGLTGCGTASGLHSQGTGQSSSTRPPATGRIAGVFEMEGGPYPGTQIRPLPGTIVLTGGGRTFTVPVGAAGRFSATVPTGTYTVAGRTPSIRGPGNAESTCRLSTPVVVGAGRTATASVVCYVP